MTVIEHRVERSEGEAYVTDEDGERVVVCPESPRLRDVWAILRGAFHPRVIVHRDMSIPDAAIFDNPPVNRSHYGGSSRALPLDETIVRDMMWDHKPLTKETADSLLRPVVRDPKE